MPPFPTSIANVTITGTTGPGSAVTTAAFTSILGLEFDYCNSIIKITDSDSKVHNFALDSTTITYTISDGVATISITNA